MAWYDIFTGNSITKHGRRVADRDANQDDRLASMRWLADQGTFEALAALCKRFELQLDHQIKDRNEKDECIDLLVEKAGLGTEAARDFARRSPAFQNVIRLIERVEGASAANAFLLELLAGESVDNEFKPEKKRNLLVTLAERRDARIVEAAAPFLLDFDEGVRHGAVEAIAAQEGDAGRQPLGQALAQPREESTRIRGRVAEIFATRRWPVPADEWLRGHLPVGWALAGDYVVVSR
ncbi:MAG: hypothetical protein FJ090_11005 [Deltaproteobacteria bacterium]|nr:hypothetical protein [Deltaproteobacteria bacterium]